MTAALPFSNSERQCPRGQGRGAAGNAERTAADGCGMPSRSPGLFPRLGWRRPVSRLGVRRHLLPRRGGAAWRSGCLPCRDHGGRFTPESRMSSRDRFRDFSFTARITVSLANGQSKVLRIRVMRAQEEGGAVSSINTKSPKKLHVQSPSSPLQPTSADGGPTRHPGASTSTPKRVTTDQRRAYRRRNVAGRGSSRFDAGAAVSKSTASKRGDDVDIPRSFSLEAESRKPSR